MHHLRYQRKKISGLVPDHRTPKRQEATMRRLTPYLKHLVNFLQNDVKDALQKMVTSFKKVMAKHWVGMAEVGVNNVVKTVRDPSCLHLCQFLSTGGIRVTEPASDIPEGWEFLRSLPEKNRKHEECPLIISTFDHISEAMAHASTVAANILALGKITEPQTFDLGL